MQNPKGVIMNRIGTYGLAVLLTGLLTTTAAWSSTLTGEVDGPSGKPVVNAFVTAQDNSRKMSVSVLTDSKGHYKIKDLFPAKYAVYARKYDSGFNDSPTTDVTLEARGGTVDLKLKPDDSRHVNTLGAAWLNALANGPMKAMFATSCAALCHDPASPMAHAPRDAAAWEATIHKMGDQSLAYATNLDIDPGKLSKWLANNRYGTKPAPLDPFAKSANVVTTERITEYQVGDLSSWAHDVAVDPQTAFVWVGDYGDNNLISIDPRNGEQKIYPVPVKGAGPHTLNFDRDGDLWITLQHVSEVARFNTKTGKWRLYSGFPPHSMDHSFPLDSEGYVKKDVDGNIYMTLFGNNRLGRLNPKTGEVKAIQLPGPATDQPYGIAMDSRGRVWYTKMGQNKMGFYNPATSKIKEWSLPRPYSGPHRMHIDNSDNLWIPLSGYGTVLRYNTQNGSQKEFKLPDGDTFPYALRYDAPSDRVWITGNGGNAIYALDPKTGKFRTFRMPSRLSYGRMVSIDYSTGDVWTSLSSYPNMLSLRDHSVVVCIHHALEFAH